MAKCIKTHPQTNPHAVHTNTPHTHTPNSRGVAANTDLVQAGYNTNNGTQFAQHAKANRWQTVCDMRI